MANAQDAEHELRRSEEKFRHLLESAPDAMVIVDADGEVVLVNAQTERMFGYGREELLGKKVDILVPHRFRGDHVRHRTRYTSEPRTRPMGADLELFGLHKNGTEFPIEISLSPIKSEEGLLVASAIRDVTPRKQIERELREQQRRVEEANRLKSEFLANMSHELRTPLNGIIGFAELMHDGKVGPVAADHREFLGDILTSARHLLQLINDVLDLAKVESGKMEFRPERVVMAAVIAEVRDILRTLAAQKRITVTSAIDPDVAEVVLDASKLKQVLYNYVSNALKFTPDGGQVTIRVVPEGVDAFRIEVEDTGIGIRPEDLDKLFVEFQQLDASVAKRHQGTGLGLALTRRIVEAQGGQVAVRSTPEKGTVFSVVLPRVAQAGAASDLAGHEPRRSGSVHLDEEPPPATASCTGSPTILVVDDDPGTLKLASATLGQLGFRAVCHSSVESGLQAAAGERPAAVILDLLLPGAEDGFSFLRRFRLSASARDVPVIVWTVKDLTGLERSQLLTLAQAVVSKHTGTAALVDELRAHVPAPAGDGPTTS
jgi:PAS domain S-box-containing protein